MNVFLKYKTCDDKRKKRLIVGEPIVEDYGGRKVN